MLSAFADRYRLSAEAAKIDPEYESKPLVDDEGSYVLSLPFKERGSRVRLIIFRLQSRR